MSCSLLPVNFHTQLIYLRFSLKKLFMLISELCRFLNKSIIYLSSCALIFEVIQLFLKNLKALAYGLCF